MAWMTYPTTGMPPAVTQRLEAVLSQRSSVLDKRYNAGPGRIEINWTGYLHHSSILAGVLLESTIDHLMVGRVWKDTRWTETCSALFRMDETEKHLVAALAGEAAPPYGQVARTVFNDALRRLIALPEVSPFFAIEPGRPDDGTHYAVRPVGFERDGTPEETFPLFTNKKAIRRLPKGYKALLALITVAYNSLMAAEVFKGQGLALKTADAAGELRHLPEDVSRDAMRLIASYSGW